MSNNTFKTLDKQWKDIPKEIVFCKNCVVSNQRPRTTFNSNGICSACQWALEKDTKTQIVKAEPTTKPKKKVRVAKLYCVESKISEKWSDFKEEYINKIDSFFYSSSVGDVCIQPYTKVTEKDVFGFSSEIPSGFESTNN